MNVPALLTVIGHLGLDGELDQQGIEPVHGRLIITSSRGLEDGVELRPDVPEHVKVAPGNRSSQPVTQRAGAG